MGKELWLKLGTNLGRGYKAYRAITCVRIALNAQNSSPQLVIHPVQRHVAQDVYFGVVLVILLEAALDMKLQFLLRVHLACGVCHFCQLLSDY